MTSLAASDRDDRPYIHRALARLRDATALPLAFGGPVNAQRQVRLTEFAGFTVGALRDVVLGYKLGLGGKVVAMRRPIVVNDYVQTPSISHQYDRIITAEGLRAIVAAPVIVRNEVRGVLYGAVRDSLPLGDRAIHSVLEVARDLEQSIAVRDELARRLDRLDAQASGQLTQPDSPRWELVREAYAELRILAKELGDTPLQQRFSTVCDKLSAVVAPTPEPGPAPTLSPREIDVLACAALGWTNGEIAADLGLTRETVKSYLRSAMHKLHSHTRLEAVVQARRLGLLP